MGKGFLHSRTQGKKKSALTTEQPRASHVTDFAQFSATSAQKAQTLCWQQLLLPPAQLQPQHRQYGTGRFPGSDPCHRFWQPTTRPKSCRRERAAWADHGPRSPVGDLDPERGAQRGETAQPHRTSSSDRAAPPRRPRPGTHRHRPPPCPTQNLRRLRSDLPSAKACGVLSLEAGEDGKEIINSSATRKTVRGPQCSVSNEHIPSSPPRRHPRSQHPSRRDAGRRAQRGPSHPPQRGAGGALGARGCAPAHGSPAAARHKLHTRISWSTPHPAQDRVLCNPCPPRTPHRRLFGRRRTAFIPLPLHRLPR